jgi:apolipoprotein N-acyltransferase
MMTSKSFLYCLLSAFLLAASFHSFNLPFLAWFGFIPLLFAIEDKSKAKVLGLSYLCGFLFFIFTLYWLVHVTLVGLIILCLYLAFYFALFGYFLVGVRHKYPQFSIPVIIFLSCVWVILEYLRGHLLTGLPWAFLGYSQYENIYLIQFADITGSAGVSFLVIFVNLCLFRVIKLLSANDRKSAAGTLAILLAMFAAVYCYGFYCVNKYYQGNEAILKASLVQGNIPQKEKWLDSHQKRIEREYLDLSRQAANDSPDMIIWPETSYPGYIDHSDDNSLFPMFITKAEIGLPILFGSVYQIGNDYFNAAILLNDILATPQIYKKIHLVPFGEYFPMRKIFFFLEPFVPIGDFSSGEEFTIFTVKNKQNQAVNFGVLICFEDTIAEFSRIFVKNGAEFLVNITNDAWFKKTSSPYQHLQASVFRAVENRVYVLRAANTGVTCAIDQCGRIVKRLGKVRGRDIFIRGFVTTQVGRTQEAAPSFYNRLGDLFILLCILYVIMFAVKTKAASKF